MAIDHPSDALPPGHRLGPYEILRVLGRGGFGVTYQARRAGVAGDMVAIKELFPSGSAWRNQGMFISPLPGADPTDIASITEMFLREAELICGIDHPNIVRGVSAFRENGTGYLVMRYVTGRSLRDSLREPGGFRPTPASMLALLAPLLDGLETLHQHQLLHCDIKPDNIFLGVGYEPILIDLGSARWLVPGVGGEESGTYSHYFSAIEQTDPRYGKLGPWTDIYQLSAVCYRCITGGKLPDAMDRITGSQDLFLPLAEIPEVIRAYPLPLIEAIDHGLAVFPAQRPASVKEWRQTFATLLPRRQAATKSIPADQSEPSPNNSPPQPPPLTPLVPAEYNMPSQASAPDFLLWLGVGLLIVILLIVAALFLDG
jgi:serine/threonine protein kinase